MWDSVIASGIAVVGTLAGTGVGGLVQLRGARAERRENRGESRRADALNAVTALVAALADHRRAMWAHENARLVGASEHRVAEHLAAHHVTRSAINVPMTTVAILAPALAGPAREAAQAAYAMRDAGSLEVLEARRAVALAACDRFVDAAAEFFTGVGVVVA
jgi:hypothetical protein